MQELLIKDNLNIEDKIYTIRGVQVMLDSDLAKLYECTNGTKDINKAVKRNMDRFDEDMYFQLTETEYKNLMFQTGTSSINHGGVRKMPYVFTESGVGMLSGILHTPKAVETSKAIMKAFVTMRHYIMDNSDIYKSITNINNTLIEHNNKFDYIFSKFNLNGKLLEIGDDNKEYIINIFKEAKNELIIIDSYLDDSIYSLIKDLDINIILITSDKKKLTINKKNINIIYNNSFHDRYIIIDKTKCFMMGSSFNSLNNKTSTIIKIEDTFIKEKLLNIVNDSLFSK